MTSTDHFHSTTFAIPPNDRTVISAWASSPLGDPEIEDGSLSQPADLRDDRPAPADFTCEPPAPAYSAPSSTRRNALLLAAVVAGIGAVAGLSVLLLADTGSHQPTQPAVRVPNSGVGSVAPQAPSAALPTPAAPSGAVPPVDNGPAVPVGPTINAPAPVVTVHVPAPADAAPPWADPGTPPAAAPPVIVPIPIPVPTYPEGGNQGGGKQGSGNQGSGGKGSGGQGSGTPGSGSQGSGSQGSGSGKQGSGKPGAGIPVQTNGGQPECLACHQLPPPANKK